MARSAYQNLDHITLGKRPPCIQLVRANRTAVTVCPPPSFRGATIVSREPKPILRLKF